MIGSDHARRPFLPGGPRWLVATLVATALLSLFLVMHNYGVPLLPRKAFPIPAESIKRHDSSSPHVYEFAFAHSEPNRPGIDRSDVTIFDDGVPLGNPLRERTELFVIGGERMLHEPGRILFSTKYNENPAENGHAYRLLSPILYSRTIGLSAAVAFLVSLAGLYWLTRRAPPPTTDSSIVPAVAGRKWRWHVAGAALLLLAGLYCNTGTLAPYAITTFPHESGGYLYSPDHVHFRAMFDFVDGADRAKWEGAILLRRILYPVLAYPFMKLGGFEIGGTIASLTLNVVGLIACGHWLRRRLGERGAVFALWLLASYPGAAYWGGLPYLYALITPGSVLLLLAMESLGAARGRQLALLSLGMGVIYLAYDFVVFFWPASVVMLLWRRRYGATGISAVLQLLPLVIWMLVLQRGFGQELQNSNTNAYGTILAAYRQANVLPLVLANLSQLPESALMVFFGANFAFLPALFLAVLTLNCVTSRIGFTAAEMTLLTVAVGVFLFNHLAPEYPGWQMRGTWIARLYQPVFPVFLLFAARWWQNLPELPRVLCLAIGTLLLATTVGNALVIFGPILKNPARISETAFYRFYNHNDAHWVYERHCLKLYGRRPLGF